MSALHYLMLIYIKKLEYYIKIPVFSRFYNQDSSFTSNCFPTEQQQYILESVICTCLSVAFVLKQLHKELQLLSCGLVYIIWVVKHDICSVPFTEIFRGRTNKILYTACSERAE